MYGMDMDACTRRTVCSLLTQILFLQALFASAVQPEQAIASQNDQSVALQTEQQSFVPPSDTGESLPVQETAVVAHDMPSAESISLVQPTVDKPQADLLAHATEVVQPQTDLPQEPPIIGIDTTSLEEPQGNWLFKRIWWERAQETYEKVRGLVVQVMDYRMDFFMHRSNVSRAILDPFYSQVGFAQGQLNEVIDRVLQSLQDEKNSTLVLDFSERSLNSDVEKIKDILEKFKVDVAMVEKLDATIDKALEQLVVECNKVRSYEQEAWQSYKKIGHELSDSKARELFYHLDVHMRYIKDIQRYLQQDFSRYFQDLIRQISSETERLLGVVNKLKEQGVDFKKQITKHNEEFSSHTNDVIIEVPEDHNEQEMIVENKGFFDIVRSKASSFFNNIKTFFLKSVKKLYSFFSKKKDPDVDGQY